MQKRQVSSTRVCTRTLSFGQVEAVLVPAAGLERHFESRVVGTGGGHAVVRDRFPSLALRRPRSLSGAPFTRTLSLCGILRIVVLDESGTRRWRTSRSVWVARAVPKQLLTGGAMRSFIVLTLRCDCSTREAQRPRGNKGEPCVLLLRRSSNQLRLGVDVGCEPHLVPSRLAYYARRGGRGNRAPCMNGELHPCCPSYACPSRLRQ